MIYRSKTALAVFIVPTAPALRVQEDAGASTEAFQRRALER
jgi:hypothetical protein